MVHTREQRNRRGRPLRKSAPSRPPRRSGTANITSRSSRARIADTDSIGYTDVTGGSRVTLASGLAVYEAANDALRQLKERAAKLWERKPEEVEFSGGIFSAKGNGVPPMKLK